MVTRPKLRLSRYLVPVIIVLAIIFSIRQCGNQEKPSGHPRDYAAIAKEGILRVATEYNSISFYVDGDTVSGFHYELIQAFAYDKGLKTEITPLMSFEERLEGLSEGRYDVIACGILATSELKDSLLLTSPITLNKQVLVQRKENGENDSLYIRSQLDLAGLGSNVAYALARIGVGHLHLIDFDVVDITNLNRQQYFMEHLGMYKTDALKSLLLKINPYLDIQTDCVKVTEENIVDLLGDEPIICEAFDRPEAKAMLVNGVLEHFPEKKLVSATGMAGYGSSNTIRTKRLMKNFYLCGDGVTDYFRQECILTLKMHHIRLHVTG